MHPAGRAGAIAVGTLVVAASWWSTSGPRSLRLEDTSSHVEPGLEVISARLLHQDNDVGQLVVAYFALRVWKPRLLLNKDRSPVGRYADGAALAANAGYFTQEFKPTGLLVDEGEVIHPLIRRGGAAGSGVLTVDGDTIRLVDRASVDPKSIDKLDFAIQAGPRIIEADQSPGIRTSDGKLANRTFIGYDRSGRLVVGAVFGSGFAGTGLTLFELQTALISLGKTTPRLQLQAVLNLDGGPSTAMYVGEVAHSESAPVASILRIVPR